MLAVCGLRALTMRTQVHIMMAFSLNGEPNKGLHLLIYLVSSSRSRDVPFSLGLRTFQDFFWPQCESSIVIAPAGPVYNGPMFFQISFVPLDGEYTLMVDMGTLKGKQNLGLAMVDRKRDKRRLIRKRTDYQRGVLNISILKTLQLLRRPNTVEIQDASWGRPHRAS